MSPGSGHLAAPHLRPVSSTNSHSTAAATLSFDGRVSSRKSRQWEHGEVGPGGVLLEEAAPKGKDRRPAAGSEVRQRAGRGSRTRGWRWEGLKLGGL